MRRDTLMTGIHRGALAGFVLMALVGLSLSDPARVAACVCGSESEGTTVFTGTVVDSPNAPMFLPDLFIAAPGVLHLDVESVIRGDPLEGRVYSGPGNCSSFFELGGKYRVHAGEVDPVEDYLGAPPGVALQTNCALRANSSSRPAR